ncbi:MAG: hypothetical protein ABMA13_16105 [Chthoniobacteraceae bacterium]
MSEREALIEAMIALVLTRSAMKREQHTSGEMHVHGVLLGDDQLEGIGLTASDATDDLRQRLRGKFARALAALEDGGVDVMDLMRRQVQP